MKAHDLIPGIVGGIAFYSVYKFGTDDGAAMALLGFSVAFLICCHNGQAVTLRAFMSGLLAAPAGLFTIGLLHMDIGNYEGGWLLMSLIVYVFVGLAYQVGKKCKPVNSIVKQGQ
jgi:uncharacterized membrane protein